MKPIQATFIIGSLFCGFTKPATPQTQPKDVIQIIESNKEYYGLVVPVSKLLMLVPREVDKITLTIGKHENKSKRYFYFVSKDSALNLSGWFESSDGYKGVKEYWDAESASLKKNPAWEPHNVKFSKSSNWDVITYSTNYQSIERFHVRAHWIQAGTWIDVHISTPTLESSLKLLYSIDISLL